MVLVVAKENSGHTRWWRGPWAVEPEATAYHRRDAAVARRFPPLPLRAMQRFRTPILTILLIAAAGYFFWQKTMAAQLATCEVCVVFNGLRQCSRASGATPKEAAQTAHATACGPVANGMNEKIACDRRPAALQRCDPPLP